MKKFALAFCVIVLIVIVSIGATSVPVATGSSFVDVPTDAWYADAVTWAAKNGITTGTDPEHFSPGKMCTRAEMITFLYRLANASEPAETPKPTTLADCPYLPPEVEHRIVPEYASCYYGRLYLNGTDYNVGLYDTLDKELVDASDAGFWMKRAHGCQMIGDHDSDGMWLIRWCGPGDTLEIKLKTGEYQKYKWVRTDPHVTNKGSDVWDQNGESLFFQLPESGLFICCCNDSEGKDMTATYWIRCG